VACGGQRGHDEIHTFDNDTGPDDANHAQHGIFVLNNGAESREVEDTN
jgi:predicted AlkP superfamily phosphohydrolase/phosphomutase